MCDVPLPTEATQAGPMEAVSTVSFVIDKHALQAHSQNTALCQHGPKKRPRDAAYFAAANRAARARKKERGVALEAKVAELEAQNVAHVAPLVQVQAQMQVQVQVI